MTQEEKQLLLKDLGGRLSCGVIIQVYFEDISADGYFDEELWSLELDGESVHVNDRWIENVKPYLRPMSSMTTEEEYEYHQCKNIDYLEICEMEHTEMLKTTALCFSRATDWLNKKGFDYRGLIPMGLALEAPEGMYKS